MLTSATLNGLSASARRPGVRSFHFRPAEFPEAAEDVRRDVRAFLASERARGSFEPHRGSWTASNPAFSKRVGDAGFIGVAWPKEYGGRELSNLVRFVITQEMLVAGAPCGAHWAADRQSGPQILRHGSERVRREILPRICRGECFFGIGMSEPDSGSDLAAVRTRGVRDAGGWRINGSKIWTTNAHHAHYLLALIRTGDPGDDRHGGLTQFLIDLSQPGITIRPILDIAGLHEFNQVFFSDHWVPDDMVLGAEGDGWSMVTQELAHERSGPERFLSDYGLLIELIGAVGTRPDRREAVEVGRMVAHLASLMTMSASIAGRLDRGEAVTVEAALVKDIGTAFEREIPELVRNLVPMEVSRDGGDPLSEVLADVLLRAPSFTIRGGTREILRSMIARGLGLR